MRFAIVGVLVLLACLVPVSASAKAPHLPVAPLQDAWSPAPAACVDGTVTHSRVWTGYLQGGQSFTTTETFCADPLGAGIFAGGGLNGIHYRLISPSGVVYDSIPFPGIKANEYVCEANPEPGTWTISMTNTSRTEKYGGLGVWSSLPSLWNEPAAVVATC